jgi:hypothetical protein
MSKNLNLKLVLTVKLNFLQTNKPIPIFMVIKIVLLQFFCVISRNFKNCLKRLTGTINLYTSGNYIFVQIAPSGVNVLYVL